ncbi:MAG TPA: hypothetical protein VKY15_00865 [Acidimicrobiales bacterium]|nr:hypothetical protein [Acidimicrobiales bacterium]
MLAYLEAFGCAVCYGLGSVLQATSARQTPAGDRLEAAVLVRVTTRLPYLVGLALDFAGWGLSLLALDRLPLFAVQAVVASAIGVAVVVNSVLTKTWPGRARSQALVTLALGLVLLALAAGPGRARPPSVGFQVALWLGIPAVAAVGAWSARLGGKVAVTLLGVASGLGFGGTALCARALESAPSVWAVATHPLTAALLAYGALGIGLFAAALQRGSMTLALSCQYAAETVVPAAVGLAFLGDHARSGWEAGAWLGFAVTLVSVLWLAAVTTDVAAA